MWHPQKSGTYNTLNFPSFLASVQTIVTLGHIRYENAVKLVWKPTSLWWKILSSLGSSTNLNCVSHNLYLTTLSFPFYGLGALYVNPLITWTPQNIYLCLIYLFSKDSRWSRKGEQQRILFSKDISQCCATRCSDWSFFSHFRKENNMKRTEGHKGKCFIIIKVMLG